MARRSTSEPVSSADWDPRRSSTANSAAGGARNEYAYVDRCTRSPARAAAGVEDALVGAEPRLQELGHERPGVSVPPVVVLGRRDAGVLLDLHQPMIVSSLSVRSHTRLSRSRKRSSSGAISSLYAG